MKLIKHIFEMKLSQKEMARAKKILALVMIPIFLLQMTSINILVVNTAKAADGDPATTVVEAVAEEPAVPVEEEPAAPPEEPAASEEPVAPPVEDAIEEPAAPAAEDIITPPAAEEITPPVVVEEPVVENAETPVVEENVEIAAPAGNSNDVQTLTEQPATGAIDPAAASTEVPVSNETPAPIVEENGDINTVVVENVKANTVDLGAIDPVNAEQTAELATDKADYAPTDTAIITGTGFIPNQSYSLIISSRDVPPVTKIVTVTADENGQFVYAYQLDGIYRPDYKVEAKNDSGEVVAAVTFTDSARIASVSGNWNSTVTWGGSSAPSAVDTVVINSGVTVTITSNTSCASLTVKSGGTLIIGSKELTVNGYVNNAGTITISTGRLMQYATGDFTNSGTITFSGSGRLYFSGNVINSGTMTLASAEVRFYHSVAGSYTIPGFTTTGDVALRGSAGTITLTGNVSGAALEIDGSGATLNLGIGLTHTFTGTWTRTAGTLNGGSSILNIGGSVSGTGGVFTASTGTVNYNASGAQTIASINYNNLVLSGSGTKTMPNNTSVTGNLSIQPTGSSKASVETGRTLQINSLKLGGVDKVSGTWGGTGSGADHIDANYFIATTGKLNVTSSAADITPPEITIVNPDTSPAQSKTITASVNEGTLAMSTTTGAVCDGTLTFIPYASTTFSSETDNGKKICYKAVDAATNTSYLMSNAIAGIDTTAPTATVAYDKTAQTNTDVVATATASEAVTYTSAGATNVHTFTSNGKFLFEFVDAAGNAGSETATVSNIDKTIPVITLLGEAEVTVIEGSTYTDKGATASDSDNVVDITANIETVNPVDTSVIDDYTVTYNVSDAAGNSAAQASRIVHVVPNLTTIQETLVEDGIQNNLDECTSSCEDLSFTAEAGKITFSGSLDLTGAETQETLQKLFSGGISFAPGSISFDAQPGDVFKNFGATLEMYGVTCDPTPAILVNEKVATEDDIDYDSIVCDSSTGTLTFFAKHFTDFSVAPTCSTGVLNGDGVSDTVDLVLTCVNAVKFASSGMTTANGTDLNKIKWDSVDNHRPSSAVISGDTMTLTFNADDGTFSQNVNIDAGAFLNSIDVSNDAISISSGSIDDNAKPILKITTSVSSPQSTSPLAGYDFQWGNTEGGTLIWSGGCDSATISPVGWGNFGDKLKYNGGAFPEGAHNCSITVVDGNGNSGSITIPEFIVDLTEPVMGDVTITPLYRDVTAEINYISGTSTISAPMTDAGTGVDGSTCAYSIDDGDNPMTDSASFDGLNCIFTNVNTIGATGINVYAKDFVHTGAFTFNPVNIPVTVDSTAPTASITSPSDGILLKGTVTITADASDTGSGVAKVEFYHSSIAPTLIGEDTTAPYSFGWDTTSVNDGSHSVYIKAYDNVGNETDYISISVTVDNHAPSIAAPEDITQTAIGVENTVDLGTPVVSDDVDPDPDVTNNAPATFPVGETDVIWTATDAAGNSAQATQKVTIEKATLAITWDDPSSIVYGTALDSTQLNASVSVPGTYAYSPDAGTVLDAGLDQTLSVTFTPDDDDTYNNSIASVSIDVSKADATINIYDYAVDYDGGEHTATGTATGVGDEDLSGSLDLTDTAHTDAGSYIGDEWTFTGGNNYKDANGTVDNSIEKIDAICNITGYSDIYDGDYHGASGSCMGIEGELDGLDLGDSFIDVPGGTADWSFTGGTNYNDQNGSVEIEILAMDITGSFTADNKVYDGSDSATVLDRSLSGVISPDVVTLDGGTAIFDDADAGTGKTVTLAGATLGGADAGNYNLDSVGTTTANIDKAEANCSITGYDEIYDNTEYVATGSCTGVDDEILSGLDLSGTEHTAAGSYLTDPWTFTDVTGNYNDDDGTVADNIDKADQAIIWSDPADIVYGTALDDTQLNATAEGALTYDPAAGTIIDAGDDQELSVTAAETDNYKEATKTVYINVLKKSITVTADSGQSKLYGDDDPELTYSSSDPVSFKGALEREDGEDVGTYAISQGSLDAGLNYDIAYIGADFAINIDPSADSAVITTTDNGDGTISGTIPNATTLTITTPIGDVTVDMPAGIVITGPDSWDGTIQLPTLTTATVPGTLGAALEIGFPDAKLSFDKGVRISLAGQSGKKIGYVRPGESFTEITNICSADDQVTGDALAADGDCKIDVSSDLVVWTKHFTKFASYTKLSSSSSHDDGRNLSTAERRREEQARLAKKLGNQTGTNIGSVLLAVAGTSGTVLGAETTISGQPTVTQEPQSGTTQGNNREKVLGDEIQIGDMSAAGEDQAPQAIWQKWWFWLIAIVVIVALGRIFWRKKKTDNPM